MVRKSYSKTGRSCRVTFEFSPAASCAKVALCGDFNDWKPSAHSMTLRKDGRYSLTINLPAGRAYQYKYLIDEENWENDPEADRYEPNVHGSQNSVLEL